MQESIIEFELKDEFEEFNGIILPSKVPLGWFLVPLNIHGYRTISATASATRCLLYYFFTWIHPR